MSTEQTIEESIQKVQAMDIEIIRGPLFIWEDGELPKACDCFGAVLIAHGKAKRNFPKGWLKELCIDILKKDTYWFWRYNFGFNQGRAIQTYTEDKKGKRTYSVDGVSKSGSQLARKLGLYRGK